MDNIEAAYSFQDLVPGYPKLSGEMEKIPELLIFRRFDSLNAQNLLYYQTELTTLARQLRACERKNGSSTDEIRFMYAKDWVYLSQCAELSGKVEGHEQLELVRNIRKCLKEYSKLLHALVPDCSLYTHFFWEDKALFYYSKLLQLEEPARYDISDIQHVLASKEMGPLALSGHDCNIWGTTRSPHSHAPDLIGLRARQKADLFTTWIMNFGVPWFFRFGLHRLMKSSKDHGMIASADEKILRITSAITTVVAAIIPLICIVMLKAIDSVTLRLVVLIVCNLMMSTCLLVFTPAKRSQCFVITTAFSAIGVVFLANNGGK